MDLKDLELQAKMLMTANGVGSLDFEFDNTKRVIATCHGVWVGRTALAKKISFSRHWGLVMSPQDCRNVMLHEIAHALTIGHDHDHVFKAKCRELGTPASGACYAPDAQIEYKWEGRCPNGHRPRLMHRAPTAVKSCASCSSSFNFDFAFTYYREGKQVELNDMPEKYQQNYRWHSNRARMASLTPKF